MSKDHQIKVVNLLGVYIDYIGLELWSQIKVLISSMI